MFFSPFLHVLRCCSFYIYTWRSGGLFVVSSFVSACDMEGGLQPSFFFSTTLSFPTSGFYTLGTDCEGKRVKTKWSPPKDKVVLLSSSQTGKPLLLPDIHKATQSCSLTSKNQTQKQKQQQQQRKSAYARLRMKGCVLITLPRSYFSLSPCLREASTGSLCIGSRCSCSFLR